MEDDRSLTAAEAAEYLGVSRPTLYAYVSRGLVTSEPESGARTRARRYPLTALEALRARRARGARAPHRSEPLLDSALTLIEGGRLSYRGRDACELSRTATLEEVAALLWGAEPGDPSRLFPSTTGERRARTGAAPVDRLIACLVTERAAFPLTLAPANEATLRAAGRTVSALFDAAGASGSGTLSARLARGWGLPADDDLRAALILCADHELNPSAFTARCVASTDAPIQNALLAAVCALDGRRHGGASREMDDLLEEVGRVGAAPACTRALERFGWLPGFGSGHPLYPSGDPRAAELLRRLALPAADPAAQVIAFAEGLGGTPSIELALAALARTSGLPAGSAFTIFALGRSVGWVAHALEAAAAGTLVRPRARYTGPRPGNGA